MWWLWLIGLLLLAYAAMVVYGRVKNLGGGIFAAGNATVKTLLSAGNDAVSKLRDAARTVANRVPTGLHTRGVGLIPTACGDDQEKIAGLCYNKCRDGYERFGMACKGACKDGWSAKKGTGACWPEHRGRGDGFESEQECLSSEDGRARGCKECGILKKRWYPNCPVGWERVGGSGDDCKRCKPESQCPDQWKTNGFGGCMRPRYIQRGVIPHKCTGDRVRENGLCYSPCPPDKPHGAGPVCYATRNDADAKRKDADDADKQVMQVAISDGDKLAEDQVKAAQAQQDVDTQQESQEQNG